MEITEVRIKLMDNPEDRLRGFCSITFDNCFVVRDLKIIEGNNGPFVAMPSRKLSFNCPKCHTKNHLRSNFCNQCGLKQRSQRIDQSDGRMKLYADIAHPVNATCREMIQSRVISELNQELELAAQPGYSSRYDEDYNEIRQPEIAAKPAKTNGHEVPIPHQRIDTGSRDSLPEPKSKSRSSHGSSDGRPKPKQNEFGQGILE